MILAKPRIEVRGVRSSWETVEMKSVFIRSTSRSTVMSRTRTTVPRDVSSAGSTMSLATARPRRPSARGISRVAACVVPIPSSSGRTSAADWCSRLPDGRASISSSRRLTRSTRPCGSMTRSPSARLSRTAASSWLRPTASSRARAVSSRERSSWAVRSTTLCSSDCSDRCSSALACRSPSTTSERRPEYAYRTVSPRPRKATDTKTKTTWMSSVGSPETTGTIARTASSTATTAAAAVATEMTRRVRRCT